LAKRLDEVAETVQELILLNCTNHNDISQIIHEKNKEDKQLHQEWIHTLEDYYTNLENWQDDIINLAETKTSPQKLVESFEKIRDLEVTQSWLDKEINITDVKINKDKKLGEGAHGTVYEGDVNGIPVAVKQLKDLKDIHTFVTECKFLSSIRGPFIARFLGGCLDEKDKKCLILTELATNGSLKTLIYGNFVLEPRIVYRLLRDIVRGMALLHDMDVEHRDLKPSNVLIDSNFRARIGDFGLSKFVSESSTKTFTGTLAYMAPELISEWKSPAPDRKDPDPKKTKFLCDVYSFGILANELVTRKPPYDGKSIEESNCYDRIVEKKRKTRNKNRTTDRKSKRKRKRKRQKIKNRSSLRTCEG